MIPEMLEKTSNYLFINIFVFRALYPSTEFYTQIQWRDIRRNILKNSPLPKPY